MVQQPEELMIIVHYLLVLEGYQMSCTRRAPKVNPEKETVTPIGAANENGVELQHTTILISL